MLAQDCHRSAQCQLAVELIVGFWQASRERDFWLRDFPRTTRVGDLGRMMDREDSCATGMRSLDELEALSSSDDEQPEAHDSVLNPQQLDKDDAHHDMELSNSLSNLNSCESQLLSSPDHPQFSVPERRSLQTSLSWNLRAERSKMQRLHRSVSDVSASSQSAARKQSSTRHHGPVRNVTVTDEDLDELRGTIDLGFGFTEQCIRNRALQRTLPALEFCSAIEQIKETAFSPPQHSRPSSIDFQKRQGHHQNPASVTTAGPVAGECSCSSSPVREEAEESQLPVSTWTPPKPGLLLRNARRPGPVALVFFRHLACVALSRLLTMLACKFTAAHTGRSVSSNVERVGTMACFVLHYVLASCHPGDIFIKHQDSPEGPRPVDFFFSFFRYRHLKSLVSPCLERHS